MKKHFIYLFSVLLFSFIFFDNVKAEEIENGVLTIDTSITGVPIIEKIENMPNYSNFSYNSNGSTYYYSSTSDIDKTLKRYNYLKSYLENNYDLENYDYFIGAFLDKDTGGKTYAYIWEKGQDVIPSISFGMYDIPWNLVGLFYMNGIDGNFTYITCNGTNNAITVKNLNELTSPLSNSFFTGVVSSTSDNYKEAYVSKKVTFASPPGPLFYESTVDIQYIGTDYVSANNYYYPKVVIDGLEFSQGDTIFTKNNEINENNKGYNFNETIDTNIYSQIEVYYKIPENEDFPFDLNLLVKATDENVPKPYLSTQDNYDTETITQIDYFLERTSETIDDVTYITYSGTYGITFFSKNYVKLTFDFSNYYGDYYIDFTSNIDFDVKYTSRIDEQQYFITIDMKDIYGLYLLPKTVNQDVFVPIYTNGEYDLFLLSDYKDSNSIKYKYPNYNNSFYQYHFYFGQHNSVIYFQNQLCGLEENLYYIKFDSRYFTYEIKQTVFDNPNLENPNTGEVINSGNLSFIEENNNEELEDNFFQYIKNIFNYFTEPIGEIFSLLTSFINGLPFELQYFFSGIFILSLVYYLFKFIL